MTVSDIVDAIQSGNKDEKLTEQLWNQIEKFIRMMARMYYSGLTDSCGIEIEDLVQNGFFAMLDALKTYDKTRGCSFLTWLGYYLKKSFSDCAGLKTYLNNDGKQRKRKSFIDNCISLDASLSEDDSDEDSLLDVTPDERDDIADTENRIYKEELHNAQEKLLATIPKREAELIRQIYYEGKPLAHIAKSEGITQSRVGQIRNNALRHLRSSVNTKPEGQELLAFIEDSTNYYSNVGLKSFMRTGCSSVENSVIFREKLMIKYYCSLFPDSSALAKTKRIIDLYDSSGME